MNKFFFCAPTLFLGACAHLHHVQIDDIDNTQTASPIELLVSESGVNIQEAGNITRSLSNSKRANKDIANLQALIALFQMGPVTGNPTYVADYTSQIPELLLQKCPSGRITGITSIRESRKYPVISGEIIKIRAFCLPFQGRKT